MNKKILISLSVIGVVATIAVGATVAYFSDTVVITGNTFSAGKIDLGVNGNTNWSGHIMAVSNMAPGTFAEAGATINNLGSLPFVATVELTGWPGSWSVGEKAIIMFWKDGDILYRGTLKNFYQKETQLFQVDPGKSRSVSYRIEIPGDVDNAYQNASLNDLVFTFRAYQVNDPALGSISADRYSGEWETSYGTVDAEWSYAVFGFVNQGASGPGKYYYASYYDLDANNWRNTDSSVYGAEFPDGPFSFPW